MSSAQAKYGMYCSVQSYVVRVHWWAQRWLFGLNKILFTHRNHKLTKQVQETQKQYAYLSVTYIQNDNHTDTYDGKMAKLLSKRQRQQNKQKTKMTTKNKQTNKQTKQKRQQQNGRRGRGLKNK